MKTFLSVLILIMLVSAPSLFFTGCSKDDSSLVESNATSDYFPFSRSYVWTYRTNVFAGRGVPDTTLEMKIDTASYTTPGGTRRYWWYFVRIPGAAMDWTPIMTLLDSAGTIYSWGDAPSDSPPDVLPWKHRYAASEGTRETITVQGKTYNTVRLDVTGSGNVTITWWFADGIGLVREHSSKGGSIFLDDAYGSDVEMNTELISYVK